MNVTLTAMGYGLANWLAFGVIALTAAVAIGLLTYDIGTGKTIVV